MESSCGASSGRSTVIGCGWKVTTPARIPRPRLLHGRLDHPPVAEVDAVEAADGDRRSAGSASTSAQLDHRCEHRHRPQPAVGGSPIDGHQLARRDSAIGPRARRPDRVARPWRDVPALLGVSTAWAGAGAPRRARAARVRPAARHLLGRSRRSSTANGPDREPAQRPRSTRRRRSPRRGRPRSGGCRCPSSTHLDRRALRRRPSCSTSSRSMRTRPRRRLHRLARGASGRTLARRRRLHRRGRRDRAGSISPTSPAAASAPPARRSAPPVGGDLTLGVERRRHLRRTARSARYVLSSPTGSRPAGWHGREHQQQPGGEGVERAGVAELPAQRRPQRAQHAERGRPGRLVHQIQPARAHHGGDPRRRARRAAPATSATMKLADLVHRAGVRETCGLLVAAAAPTCGRSAETSICAARAQRDAIGRDRAVGQRHLLADQAGHLDALDRPQVVDQPLGGGLVAARPAPGPRGSRG